MVNENVSFFSALKEKVDYYFLENRLSQTGERRLYLKSAFQISTALSTYIALVFLSPPWWVSIFLCLLLGINLAVLGFNVMHEGGHQSFSKYQWLNSLAGYSLNALGGNIYFWKVKHNINHHTFTNIAGIDSDIDVQPFMRLHPNQPLTGIHRYQHIYGGLLYGISYLAWVFYEDFVKYFRNRIALHMKPMSMSLKEHFVFWLTKIVYVTVFLVIPVIFTGWLNTMIGFFMITFVTGLFISIVFQLAHVVEVTEFPSEKKIVKDWAVHQVSTTSNFATTNKVICWLLGGLNFQIEHHLFPKISHIHYPQISKLVKETCKEFNVTYNEYASMFDAIISHISYLRKMGTTL
ncbi:fatty acid desaturase [Cytophagales bacterium WSM2-2]|nr:fatty acid desaturase [Cytophagales bacterium WSM2-2]